MGRPKGSLNKKTIQAKENYHILDYIGRYKLWGDIQAKIQQRIALAIFPLAILSAFNLGPALFNLIGLMIAYYWAERK